MADSVTHLGPVAMNVTVCAGRLVDPERTAIKTPCGVVLQLGALLAEFALGRMMMATIDPKHRGDSSFLTIHQQATILLVWQREKRVNVGPGEYLHAHPITFVYMSINGHVNHWLACSEVDVLVQCAFHNGVAFLRGLVSMVHRDVYNMVMM